MQKNPDHLSAVTPATTTIHHRPFDHADRDKIKERAEADFLHLFRDHGGKCRGKDLHCPFHHDRTPSARLYRGRFHCFVCNLSLDPIGFIERVQRPDFKGALSYLSDRYSVPLNQHTLTAEDRRKYAAWRSRAEREAGELVIWRRTKLAALRKSRNWRLAAYHRAKWLIIQAGLDHPRGTLWADLAERYELEYEQLDKIIQGLEREPYSELLPIFRAEGAA
jgi:hypothetical protein